MLEYFKIKWQGENSAQASGARLAKFFHCHRKRHGMNKNKPENCTHPVPPNAFGVTAMHCYDNQPIPVEQLQPFFEKQMKRAHKKMLDHAQQKVVERAQDIS